MKTHLRDKHLMLQPLKVVTLNAMPEKFLFVRQEILIESVMAVMVETIKGVKTAAANLKQIYQEWEWTF